MLNMFIRSIVLPCILFFFGFFTFSISQLIKCGSGCFLNSFLCRNTCQWCFFYFLKIIFDISTSKRFKKYKPHSILTKKNFKIWWNAITNTMSNDFLKQYRWFSVYATNFVVSRIKSLFGIMVLVIF